MKANKTELWIAVAMALGACSKSPQPAANEEPVEAPAPRPSAPPAPRTADPDHGKALFDRKGCVQCHSVNGTPSAGPTLKGRWGQPVQLEDGRSVTFDEAYARESLVQPLAKVPRGFVGNMPAYSTLLRDSEVEDLIAYMKTL